MVQNKQRPLPTGGRGPLGFIEKVVFFIKQPYLATISFHHALF